MEDENQYIWFDRHVDKETYPKMNLIGEKKKTYPNWACGKKTYDQDKIDTACLHHYIQILPWVSSNSINREEKKETWKVLPTEFW